MPARRRKHPQGRQGPETENKRTEAARQMFEHDPSRPISSVCRAFATNTGLGLGPRKARRIRDQVRRERSEQTALDNALRDPKEEFKPTRSTEVGRDTAELDEVMSGDPQQRGDGLSASSPLTWTIPLGRSVLKPVGTRAQTAERVVYVIAAVGIGLMSLGEIVYALVQGRLLP